MRRVIAVALVLSGLWVAREASAATCSVACVDITVSNQEQSSCTASSCQSRCLTYCRGTRYGCASWSCSGGPRSPDGDNCATAYANTTARKTTLEGLIRETNAPAGSWTCQSVAFSSDRCIGPGACSGSDQQCCAPERSSVNCADTAIASSVSGHPTADDVTLKESTYSQGHEAWSCRTPANDTERDARCVRGGCPGSAENYCCLRPGGERTGPAECVTRALAAGGATSPQIEEIKTSSGSDTNTWSCRQATAAERATGGAQRCISGGCRGSTYCCAPAASAAGPCADTVIASHEGTPAQRAEYQTQLESVASELQAPLNTWTCQRICGSQTPEQARRCTTESCPGQPETVKCCAPSTGSPPAQECAGEAGEAGAAKKGGAAGAIGFDTSCWEDGNCTLDDIVRAGTAFANYLFGISGAVFLLIFVYGGFRYLIAGGDTGDVQKSKEMIRNATIGILLMFGAAAIIRWIQTTVTRPAQSTESLCEQRWGDQGYVCQHVPGEGKALKTEATRLGCLTGLCNLADQGPNMLCCPVTGAGTEGPGPAAPARIDCTFACTFEDGRRGDFTETIDGAMPCDTSCGGYAGVRCPRGLGDSTEGGALISGSISCREHSAP